MTNDRIERANDPVAEFIERATNARVPQRYKEHLRKAADKLADQMASDFDQQLRDEVAKGVKAGWKQVRADREKLEQEREWNSRLCLKARRPFTKDEFQLLLSVVYPDRNSHPKATKAFQLIRELQEATK